MMIRDTSRLILIVFQIIISGIYLFNLSFRSDIFHYLNSMSLFLSAKFHLYSLFYLKYVIMYIRHRHRLLILILSLLYNFLYFFIIKSWQH